MTPRRRPPPESRRSRGIDPVKLRLSIVAFLVLGAFVALYSRLWYLQVLAVDEYKQVAQNNRIRIVKSEPPRGRILDRFGHVLVKDRPSLAIALRRELLENPFRKNVVLTRLAKLLPREDLFDLYAKLRDVTVSPYKPLPVAYDIPEQKAIHIREHKEKFPDVVIDTVSFRQVVRGHIAPHVLGYTNEISAEELKDGQWRGYEPGDIIGKDGVERSFDAQLRGQPLEQKVVVDATGEPIDRKVVQDEEVGLDVVTTISPRIQKVTQGALTSGVNAARGAGFSAPSGAAVVMNVNTGDVVAMASFPTYNARILADGWDDKDERKLGLRTPDDYSDDALSNRPIDSPLQPGSTFKAITAAAALHLDVVGAYDYLECPGTFSPPGDEFTEFYNWTSASLGAMGFEKALEISCNTFFFNLGSRMEYKFGEAGDKTYQFQRYARRLGLGRRTGIQLPDEDGGLVPDPTMCDQKGLCHRKYGYLPGYTINMAVGQGDLLATPLQMAMAYGAIANGGQIVKPRIVRAVGRKNVEGELEIIKEFEPVVQGELELDDAELGIVKAGLEAVTHGGNGTANDVFVGSPVRVAGKTGTAQIGQIEGYYHSWFISYAPADDPKYVTAVYVERAGYGADTAAPIARQIWDGIFSGDLNTNVNVSSGGYD